MKPEDLKQLSQEDLASKLYSCKEELGKLNYQKRIGQVEKPHRFKELRRTIARIHTLVKCQKSEPAKKN
jgi:large subunit ribosomal protein L29